MENAFESFGLMIDCSRNAVASPAFLKGYIELIARMGYNSLLLYTEDTYEVDGEPYFGYQRGRYTKDELKMLDQYASERGVTLIPCIQTLAHLERIFHWDCYDSLVDCGNILLCGEEETYRFIDRLFRSVSECFSSKTVHIGMDEAHMIGRGRYQDIHGSEDHTQILLRHLGRISALGRKYGFSMIMWSDMFFRLGNGGGFLSDEPFPGVPDEVRAQIPDNIELVYWDYYFTEKAHFLNQMDYHDRIKKTDWYAGGLWSWLGFAPHNLFSVAEVKASLAAAREHGVKHVFLTLWGDDGGECARLSLLPSMWYAACLARGIESEEEIRASFLEQFGVAYETFLLLDLPGTPQERGDLRVDADKFMLYNDPFLGLIDDAVEEGGAQAFAEAAERLAEASAGDYAYLFRTMEMLCRVLAVKYDLGVRTRAAYRAGDRAQLRAIAGDYGEAVKRLDAFYEAFEAQWMRENKPQGFEVQDTRLGGLEKRLKHCRKQLLAYLDGSLEEIPELLETPLPFRTKGNPPYLANRYQQVISVNPI